MSTYIVKQIAPDGTIAEINRRMTLKEMQQAVEGYIELVPSCIKGHYLVVNDEGLMPLEPKYNEIAHNQYLEPIYRKSLEDIKAQLAGTVLLAKGKL